MALTVVDNRIVLNQADNNTGVTSSSTADVFTADPFPIEATACLGMAVSNSTDDAYWSITSDNYSLGGSISIWVQDNGAMDTKVNGGVQIIAGDGTNRIGYHVGGSDATGFRHDQGPVKWTGYLLDLANKPTNFTVYAGAEASLNEAAITQVGVAFKTLSKAVGGATNCFWDISRFADPGVGINVYGGTIGTPETLATLAATDRSTGNLQGLNIIRALGAGVYGIQGNINLGDPSGTNNLYLDIISETIVFESRTLSANNFYRFNIVSNATGSTTIQILSSSFVSTNSSVQINVNDNDLNSIIINNNSFSGIDQGINCLVSQDWKDNNFASCGIITTTGSDFRGSSFTDSIVTAGTGSLFWNSTVDPDGFLDECSFTRGSILNHAIEFPTGMTNQSITLRNIDFTGYNASNAQNDSTINVLATSGTLTINVIGGSGNVSYKTAGATVSVVQNPVTTTITVENREGTVIEGAVVYLIADTGGPLASGTEIIKGLTDVNGQITDTRTLASSQPITGWVRKGSTQPYYQEGIVLGTINNITGLSLTIVLIEDE